jgi:hypothetical protein
MLSFMVIKFNRISIVFPRFVFLILSYSADESDDDEAPRRKRRLAEKAALGDPDDEEVKFFQLLHLDFQYSFI